MADGGMWGLNVSQVRELGQRLTQKAEEVDQIVNQVSAQVESVSWKGPDAERFKNEWNSQHKTALKKAAESLREAGRNATKNAQMQEQTSNQS
ncbi:WXG100 family type VII secretion target [Antribacter gilvus]|uniref:WXG100 family type VII secretion target n=1 Tax=Antribacter gilvus TaxID=2304675 RepID=UPI000F7663D6|nr:WXG100 family type VII secretion target [Antribacter gilvus]